MGGGGRAPRPGNTAAEAERRSGHRARGQVGEAVAAGQMLGQVPEKALGAPIHAPFAARVVSVSDRIVLERTP